MMTIKTLVSWVTGLGVIVGTAFVVDGRYYHATAAELYRRDAIERALQDRDEEERVHKSIREYAEVATLNTQMKINRVRLSFLLQKRSRTVDEDLEIDAIRQEMAITQQRISTLQR
jgi:hypothetical protein